MASFLLFIERQTRPAAGASCGIRRQPAPCGQISRELLAWLCFCPEPALEVSRIGPVWIAHGGDWARARELESFHWPHLGGTRIHGKAVAVGRGSHGCWAAFSEAEALRSQSVLLRHCTRPEASSCPVHWAIERSLCWADRVRFRAASPAEKARLISEQRRQRLALRQQQLQALGLG